MICDTVTNKSFVNVLEMTLLLKPQKNEIRALDDLTVGFVVFGVDGCIVLLLAGSRSGGGSRDSSGSSEP